MTSDNRDEKELIELAREDLSNFKLLYEKYMKAVFRYCYNRVGRNRELAEDITSEVFVKAIEKFDSYQYQNKPFVVWLYTIAHNLIVDYFRSKKERNISFDSLLIKPTKEEESLLDEATKEDLVSHIDEVAGELPDKVNHLLTLRYTEDLTFKEMGRLMGKSEAAVKMQFYRALDHLKKLIAEKQN